MRCNTVVDDIKRRDSHRGVSTTRQIFARLMSLCHDSAVANFVPHSGSIFPPHVLLPYASCFHSVLLYRSRYRNETHRRMPSAPTMAQWWRWRWRWRCTDVFPLPTPQERCLEAVISSLQIVITLSALCCYSLPPALYNVPRSF